MILLFSSEISLYVTDVLVLFLFFYFYFFFFLFLFFFFHLLRTSSELFAVQRSPSSDSLLNQYESSLLTHHGVYHDLFVCPR